MEQEQEQEQEGHRLLSLAMQQSAQNDPEAADNYCKAATQYTIANLHVKASLAFELAARIKENNNQKCDAACYYRKAVNCLPAESKHNIVLLNKVIKLYLDDGKFASAANNYDKLGHIQITEKYFYDAITSFEEACKYYEIEGSISTATMCLTKATYLLIDLKEFDKALVHLRKIYTNYNQNTLTNFKCIDIFSSMMVIKLHLNTSDECKEFLKEFSVHSNNKGYKLFEILINTGEGKDLINKYDFKTCKFNADALTQ